MKTSRSAIQKSKLKNQSVDATILDKEKEQACCNSSFRNRHRIRPRRRSSSTEYMQKKRVSSYRSSQHRSSRLTVDTQCIGVGCEIAPEQQKLDMFKVIYQKWKSFFHLRASKTKLYSQTSKQDCQNALADKKSDQEQLHIEEMPTCSSKSEELFAFESFIKSLALYTPYFHENRQENNEQNSKNICNNHKKSKERATKKKNIKCNNCEKHKQDVTHLAKEQSIIHPDGEELYLQKQHTTKILTAKKCRIQSTLYPTFHQTAWEFSPKFKLIAQPL